MRNRQKSVIISLENIRLTLIVCVILWGAFVASCVLMGFDSGLSARDYKACVVSLSIVCSVWMVLFGNEGKSRFRVAVIVVLLLLIIQDVFALFSLASRTSCLAAVVGIVYLIIRHIGCDGMKARNVVALLAVLVVVIAISLYFIRPDSANGRFFIWRVCINMFTDNCSAFLFGYGINGFSKYYMPAQGDYLSTHPACGFIPLADDVFTPYNEFLHLAITFGLLGLIVMTIVLLSVFIVNEHDSKDVGMKSLLICFIVFSCFSFPFSSPLLCLLIVISLLTMKKRFLRRILNIFLTVLFVSISAGFGLEYLCLTGINESIRSYAQESPVVRQPISEKVYEMSKHFPDILTYLAVVSYYSRDIKMETGLLYPIISRDAAELVPSTRTYCMFAELLVSNGQYEDACEIYRRASDMVPLKLAPRFGVLKCQISQSETIAALETAEQILSVPIKIRSRHSIEIIVCTKHLADSLRTELETSVFHASSPKFIE